MKKGSFTNWYKDAKLENYNQFLKEDSSKGSRLKLLSNSIEMPINEGLEITVRDFLKITTSSSYSIMNKPLVEVKLGIRVLPLQSGDKILRNRGNFYKSIKNWLINNEVSQERLISVLPHVDNPVWATIFFIGNENIIGEAINDAPHILTQGLKTDKQIIQFQYSLKNRTLELSNANSGLENHLNEVFKFLEVSNYQKQVLEDQLNIQVSHSFLTGYFETVYSDEYGLWFIDYNRILKLSNDFRILTNSEMSNNVIYGTPTSRGTASGRVNIINELADFGLFQSGNILACDMTTPDYIDLMKSSAGIITRYGGMLSHAAIISRELNIPCISGLGDSFDKIKDKDYIKMDATSGKIELI